MKQFTLTCFFLFISYISIAVQQVTISNISFKEQSDKEINCLAMKFDATLKYSYNELLLQRDSSTQYLIEVFLKQSALLNANKGYTNYRNPEGKVKASFIIPLSNDMRAFENLTLLIPFGAIDIPDGMQEIKPVFVITDKQSRAIANNSGSESFNLSFPQKLNLNISVKEIVVSDMDFKNEFWDYFITDTNSANPEVCWSVMLGSRKINGSKHTNNECIYSDLDGKDDVEFTISKNDIFYINVYDYDKMSFSDDIGSLRMDMNTLNTNTNILTAEFGKVLRMEYAVKVF